ISQENVSFNFLKYVQAEGSMIPDILDNINTLTINPQNIQPLWIAIKVPNNTIAGKYIGEIGIYSGNADTIKFTINLEVLNMELPTSDNWTFHLDLWQNPYAVARYFNVSLWSKEHIDYLKPHLKLLKSAGQKVITTTIMKDPWNSQTYDPYGGMVKWSKNTNGTFSFDFTDFDIYVQLCLEIGIKKQINCYSMVPWNNRVFYFDQSQNKEINQSLIPGSTEWISVWQQFISAFVAHLKLKSWENITYVAMDERPSSTMNAVFNLLQGTPLKISGAISYDQVSALNNNIQDMSIAMRDVVNETEVNQVIKNRRDKGFNTTTYLATGDYPNSFTKSNPAESAWIGWYSSKINADGFLRWAYDSWVKAPLVSTDHVKFESGDCFQVYPERSSVRFERLIEGIQDNEKIRYILKNYSEWAVEINKVLSNLKRGTSLGDGIDFGVEVNN
ncbi:MAG: glycoside hydrolase domain-containing protein, partial [Sarcina sp.]